MISFTQVPVNIRVPGVYIEMDPSKAFRGLSGIPNKVLIIGQKLAAAPAAVEVPTLITSIDQAKALYGRGSQLAHAVEKFIGANSFVELWAIPQLDNAAGVAATAAVTFTGTATAAGTMNIYIGGRQVQFVVTSGMTAAQVATAFAAAVTANVDLPCTAAAVAGVVTLTARHKGECANFIDVRANYYADQFTPAGITFACPGFTSGTGNPDVNTVLTAIGDDWYSDFVMPYTDSSNIVAFETELTSRWDAMSQIDGHLYLALSDTHGNLITKGNARNHPNITQLGLKGCPNPPYELAAALAAVSAFNLKNDPARPLQTLALPGIMPPSIKDRFTLQERNLLLYAGISTVVTDGGGNVVIERIITGYRLNKSGLADPAYLNIETVKTLTYLRYDLRVMITTMYPRHKLADDGTNYGLGQAIVTPSVLRASTIARAKQWEEAGLVENIEQFKEALVYERSTTDLDRVDAIIPPNIINQFRVMGALLQHRL